MLLNLDPLFEPLGKGGSFKSWMFSGGEVGFKLGQEFLTNAHWKNLHDEINKVTITARLTNSDRVIELIMATDALRRVGYEEITLYCPYIPYARQDRLMVPGESLSLKVFADLINGQNYKRVYCYDIHNVASLALFNNIENISSNKFGYHVIKRICAGAYEEGFHLIVPDFGATKRVYELAKYIKYTEPLITCEKIRDVSTGEIIHTKVHGDIIQNAPCFIYDDLIDGGKSFIEIAKVLKQKGAGHVNLVVSHGIFSKGFELENIDRIFVTDSFRNIVDKNITQVKLDESFLL